MVDLVARLPAYGWDVNKGYATPEHREAIRQHGPCDSIAGPGTCRRR